MGVNLIGVGSGCFGPLIGRLRVHRIDRDARFQQERDQQAVVGFDNACQVLGRSRDAEQKRLQLVQAVMAMGKAPYSHALAREIGHLHVMMGVCPVQSNVPHAVASFSSDSRATPGGIGSFYTGWQTARPSNHRLAQESCQRKNDLSLSVKPCGARSLSPAVLIQQDFPADPSSRGSGKIVTYKEQNRSPVLFWLPAR